jgi:hypothetical protein
LPYIDIPAGAAVSDLVPLTYQCQNPKQRAELISQLVGAGGKDLNVLKLLRAYAQNPHPLVRTAAQEGLETLFGAKKAKTRDIPPPLQPPRRDD